MDSMRRTLQERSWRVPGGERRPPGGEKRTTLDRLNALFAEFADPETTSCAARGLVQGIMLTIGNDGWRNNEDGRMLREIVVTFLTDIGTADPDRCERDPEVREAACKTLAQHVCPIIAAVRRGSYDSYYHPEGKHTAAIQEENFWTLSHLVHFYERMSAHDVHHSMSTQGLDGKHLQNVKECLGRVYRELRRQLNCGPFENDPELHMVNDEVHVRLQQLNHLFVECRWWDVLSLVRAVSAIPDLYKIVTENSSVPSLQFDWGHLERFRCDDRLARRMTERHKEIEHDLLTIQVNAGGKFDPQEHQKLSEFTPVDIRHKGDLAAIRPLLLDFASTFVREVWFTHVHTGE